jgi:CRP-like cAMP-binding protein
MDYGVTVGLLRRMPLFCGMDAGTLKLLAFSSAYLHFEDGEVLCAQGDAPDGVFIIDTGTAEVVVVAANGSENRVARVGRHEVVGEMAVILNKPRTATVRATGPVDALKIDSDVFVRLITGHPEAALSVLRTLSERLAALLHRLPHQ